MFCPQCGSTQSDELKFCKTCGANLHALRRVMASRDESDEKFDWGKTWVAEMFMSSDAAARRAAELERIKGKTPETKRIAEIKAGVVNASVGIALMIFLYVFMQGLIASGAISDVAAVIISKIWLVGLLPLFVGLALIVNGVVVSKRLVNSARETGPEADKPGSAEPSFLPPADTTNLASSAQFSVTDETTKNLVSSKRI